jgi:hypothetical protein
MRPINDRVAATLIRFDRARTIRLAEAREVGCDHPMPGGENRDLSVPQPGVDRPPMDQHHRRSLPRVPMVEAEAINGDVRHLSMIRRPAAG